MAENADTRLSAEMDGRGFWLRWLPTLFGFIAGGALGTAAAGRLDTVVSALIGGAITGAVIGGAQWLVLRRMLPGATWWIGATAVGQAVGLAVGARLADYGTGPDDLVLQGAIAGLAIGSLQAIVLHRGTGTGGWWAPAMVPLSALGWFIMWAAQIDVEQQFFSFGFFGAVAFTVLSGFGLVRVQRLAGPSDLSLRLASSSNLPLRPFGRVVQ